MAEDLLDPRARGGRRFVGKVCIVTGAGQGIGAATCRRLAQEGAKIVAEDLYSDTAERTAKELTDFGAEAIAFAGDMSDPKVAQELMKTAKNTFGRIDVLCNIAGGTFSNKPFELYSVADVEREIPISFWTAMWGCHSVLPYMLEQGSGAIVNTSSHAVQSVDRVPYAAAKGGVVALTTSLSKEIAPMGLRINAVAPHSTAAEDRVHVVGSDNVAKLTDEEKADLERRNNARRANEIPMNRRGSPDEQASAFVFLASEDASFISGQILPCGGGATYR